MSGPDTDGDAAGAKLAELLRQRDRLARENRTLAGRLDAFRDRVKHLENKIDELVALRRKLRTSGSYQLGELLVGAGLRRREIFRLPDRLVRLGVEHLRRRGMSGRWMPSLRPLNRHVYEGTYRVAVPTARPISDPIENRILHLLEYSLPHKQNGYTLRSRQVVRAQLDHGWDPVVVTRPGFPETGGANGTPENLDGIPHYRLPPVSERPALADYTHSYVTGAAELVEKLRPSIIQAGSNFRNAYAAMELARNYNLPFVYEVRGLWEETRVANRRLERYDRKYEMLVGVENYCMNAAHAIVTLGESLKAELIRRGVAADKIFLVRNAVDMASVDIRAAKPELRTSLGITAPFVVGYIGSVSRLESLHILVEAMKILRRERSDIAALIVGSGIELEKLQALATGWGLEDCVHFAGSVPHSEIADYYAICDVIACTRGHERVCETVTPLKPYEAMAYRKPAIVSNIPALREMVRDHETGRVVPAEDPHALARAIEALADAPGDCAAMADRAQDWVREHRNWHVVTEAYGAAYEHAKHALSEPDSD